MPSEVQFFQTAMGRTFFEYTMPALVKQITRLNENLEKFQVLLERTNKEDKEKADGTIG